MAESNLFINEPRRGGSNAYLIYALLFELCILAYFWFPSNPDIGNALPNHIREDLDSNHIREIVMYDNMEQEIYLYESGKEALKNEQSGRDYFPSVDDNLPDYMVLLSENQARNPSPYYNL